MQGDTSARGGVIPLPPLGVDAAAIASYEELSYEAYVDPGSGASAGRLCWLDTTDPRVRAGIWRLDASECGSAVGFLGPERFKVLDGFAEVVVDDVVLMRLGPGDVGIVAESVLTHWWISPPFAKVFLFQQDEGPSTSGGRI